MMNLNTRVAVNLGKKSLCTNTNRLWAVGRFVRGNCSEAKKGLLKYSQMETQKILSVINNAQADHLLEHTITKHQAAKIIEHRRMYGHYNDLQCVLKVTDVIEENLEKLCDSIVRINEQKKPAKKYSRRNMCFPENLQTVTALTVLGNSLTWARVRREKMQIDKWNYVELQNNNSKSFVPHVVFENVIDALDQVPPADVYVMEQLPVQVNKTAMPGLLCATALQASLIALLNKEFKSTRNHVVHILRPSVVTNHFAICVGTERVSCKNVVSRLLRNEDRHRNRVTIDDEMHRSYLQEKDFVKEDLGTALLIALAFYEVFVYKLN